MGALDDGYISSTGHFKNAFKKRPDDMKRRILAYVSESREEMFREEQRWLDMIKDEELCVRYYNVKKRAQDKTLVSRLSLLELVGKMKGLDNQE